MESITITPLWTGIVVIAVALLLWATSRIRNLQGYREARKEFLGKPMKGILLPKGVRHKLWGIAETGTSKQDKILVVEYQSPDSSWSSLVCAEIDPADLTKARLQQGDTFVITQNCEIIKEETPVAKPE